MSALNHQKVVICPASLAKVLQAACTVVIAISIGGCGISRQLLYSPPQKAVTLSDSIKPPPEHISVRASDELELAGYYWPGAFGDHDAVIFSHGGNWSAEKGAKFAQFMVGAGNSVMVGSYRGFGADPGFLNKAGILRDAAAFIVEAPARNGPNTKVRLVDHSISAAVALHAAAQDHQVSGVLAMSTFERITQAAPRRTRAFIPKPWNNLEALNKLTVPVIFVQGGVDRFIPSDSGDGLFSTYRGPSSLVMGVTSRHNPEMTILGPWINQGIETMNGGKLTTLPPPPRGWVEKIRRP